MTITEVTGRQAIYMLDIEHGYLVGRNGAGNQTGSECRKLQNVCKGQGQCSWLLIHARGLDGKVNKG